MKILFIQPPSRVPKREDVVVPPLGLAYLAAFRGLPGMWKKRNDMKKRPRVSEDEIRTWFRRFGMSVREISLIG